MDPAVACQPGVDPSHILVEDPVETARPRLRNTVFLQPGHERGRLVCTETSEWPARKVHVDINNHTLCPFALRIGVSNRRRFSPRISRLADSGISAPITFAS